VSDLPVDKKIKEIVKDQYLAIIRSAGFEDVCIVDESHAAVQVEDQQGRLLTEQDDPRIEDLMHSIASIKVQGVKRVTG
jgi:hypothetical protein